MQDDAENILQTISVKQTLASDAQLNTLELYFGEKCVEYYIRLQVKSRYKKASEALQELERARNGSFTSHIPLVQMTCATV